MSLSTSAEDPLRLRVIQKTSSGIDGVGFLRDLVNHITVLDDFFVEREYIADMRKWGFPIGV